MDQREGIIIENINSIKVGKSLRNVRIITKDSALMDQIAHTFIIRSLKAW